jgi:hypothetical protein
MKQFKLGGFLILKSSKNCYHVLFNRKVSWTENVSIMASVCIQLKKLDLQKWFFLQCRKGKSTLRISPKGKKSSPRIVFRSGNEDKQIREFLSYRKFIKEGIRKMDRIKEGDPS